MPQKMLPAGWLREPIEGLSRCDAVVVSHATRLEPTFSAKVEALVGHPPIAWTT